MIIITGPLTIGDTLGLPKIHLRASYELSERGIGPSDGGGTYYYKDEALCARDGGRIIGFITYRYEKGEGGLWIMMGWVDQPYRRQGIYTRLWEALVEEAKKLHAVRILGSTHLNNQEMREFYKKVGRVETHVTGCYTL